MENLSEMYLFMFALSETICLLTGCLLSVLPHITRKSLLFGVRIPDAAKSDPDVRRLKKIYTAVMIIATAAVLAGGALLYAFLPQTALMLSLYQPTCLILVQFAVFIPLWKKSTVMKVEKNWQVGNIGTSQTAVSSAKGRIKDLPWIWYVISALLCLLGIIYGLAVYPTLPEIIVTHWNGNMTADAWSPKSLMDVFIMPLISLSLILLMLGSNVIIFYTKLQVSIENPVLSYAQHRMYRKMTSHMLGFITLILTVMMIIMMPMILNQYIPTTPVLFSTIFIFSVLMIIPGIWVPVKTGQGGSRLKPVLTAAEEKDMETFSKLSFRRAIDRGDDSFWKLGLFYFNKDDPSLFVEDRFGSNGGFNLAKPAGKIIVSAIVLLVLVTYAVSTVIFLQMM